MMFLINGVYMFQLTYGLAYDTILLVTNSIGDATHHHRAGFDR